MADIVFQRTGELNPNGSVPGKLRIGEKTWDTIERGGGHTFVRKGTYELLMCHKTKGRPVCCLCFHESRAISTHLIHDAQDDKHTNLEGCIAPGLSADVTGIKDSAAAMKEVLDALGAFDGAGNFKEYQRRTIDVLNNIGAATETRVEWIKRREAEAEAKLKPKAAGIAKPPVHVH
jgi:hypothetical protein